MSCTVVLTFWLFWTAWYSVESLDGCDRRNLLIHFDADERIVWIAHGNHGGSFQLPKSRGLYGLVWREEDEADIDITRILTPVA